MFNETQESYLKIKNETKIKIKRIRVENSGDGFQSSRPGNFNNESIEPNDYLKKRLECVHDRVILGTYLGGGAKTVERKDRSYKMVLEFADKFEVAFSIQDQLSDKWESKSYDQYSGYGKYDLQHEVHKGALERVITVRADTNAEQNGNKKEEEANKQADRGNYKQAIELMNEAISTNPNEAERYEEKKKEFQDEAELYEEVKDLNKQADSFQQLVQDRLENDKKQFNKLNEKSNQMENKLVNQVNVFSQNVTTANREIHENTTHQIQSAQSFTRANLAEAQNNDREQFQKTLHLIDQLQNDVKQTTSNRIQQFESSLKSHGLALNNQLLTQINQAENKQKHQSSN